VASEAIGRGFESLRARQIAPCPFWVWSYWHKVSVLTLYALVAGCAQAVDKERLQRLLTLGWTKQELSDGFARARKTASEDSLKNIDLLGATLALPDQQCDFAADATCKKTFKPLTKDAAVRVVERLQPLSTAWASTVAAEPDVKETKEEVELRDRLAEQYQKEMEQAAELDATGGLARMRKILADEKYQHLGIFLDSYSFGQGLGRWSREPLLEKPCQQPHSLPAAASTRLCSCIELSC
jgi:hypothetical protein